MATKGNLISKANCASTSKQVWFGSRDWNDAPSQWDGNIWYICAPAWRILYQVNKTIVSSGSLTWSFWRYENGAFVHDNTWADSWSTGSQTHEYKYWFYHNSSNPGGNKSYLVGKPCCDLWKFTTTDPGWFQRDITIYADSIGGMRDDAYNEWKGKPICSNGSMKNFVVTNCSLGNGGEIISNCTDADAVEYFRNSRFRGSQIFADQEQYMVATDNYR